MAIDLPTWQAAVIHSIEPSLTYTLWASWTILFHYFPSWSSLLRYQTPVPLNNFNKHSTHISHPKMSCVFYQNEEHQIWIISSYSPDTVLTDRIQVSQSYGLPLVRPSNINGPDIIARERVRIMGYLVSTVVMTTDTVLAVVLILRAYFCLVSIWEVSIISGRFRNYKDLC